MVDAISRQATLEHVQRLDHLATLPDGDFVVRLSEVEDAIINGLPAQPQRKPGRWIKSDTDGFVCSACRNGYKNQPTIMGKPMFEFCPCCGERMENGGNTE